MSKADNSLMIMENSKVRSEEYEELLLRRDQLFRESGSYMTAYTQEFGDLITANFELKVECIKKKKTISYCRRRMNRGLAEAYQKSDVDELDDLEVLVRRAMEEMGDDSFELNLDDIETRIERVENQINEILTTSLRL